MIISNATPRLVIFPSHVFNILFLTWRSNRFRDKSNKRCFRSISLDCKIWYPPFARWFEDTMALRLLVPMLDDDQESNNTFLILSVYKLQSFLNWTLLKKSVNIFLYRNVELKPHCLTGRLLCPSRLHYSEWLSTNVTQNLLLVYINLFAWD